MSRRILVIEDNASTREFLSCLLEAFGYSVRCAEDGLRGVEMAIGDPPDVIVCDVHMPKLDGFGVLRHLKQNPATRNIPLIAVTALAMVDTRKQLLSAGFDAYLPKPVDPERFAPDIERLIPEPSSKQESDQ